MTALCEFFPGADTPIDYSDCEDREYSDSLDGDYMAYDTREGLDTDPEFSTERSAPVALRHAETRSEPRPRSFVETQVSKLQTLMAAEAHPKTAALPRDEPDLHNRIGPVRIPQTFKKPDHYPDAGRSPVTINRTSSSPVPERAYMPSEGSTPQDSLRIVRSPVVFSESSSPRRLSPIVNYNIGNMNPRHIDIEQYWNRENDKLSPARSPSVLSSSNSVRKEDYNQNYCDRLSAGNSPMTPLKEYNGNIPQRLPMDPKYRTPLSIEVDPVSSAKHSLCTHCNLLCIPCVVRTSACPLTFELHYTASYSFLKTVFFF